MQSTTEVRLLRVLSRDAATAYRHWREQVSSVVDRTRVGVDQRYYDFLGLVPNSVYEINYDELRAADYYLLPEKAANRVMLLCHPAWRVLLKAALLRDEDGV